MALAGDSTSPRIQVEDQLLPPVVAASWGRCIQHGLRRRDRALFGATLTRGRERRVAAENADLIARATPEMERLYGLLGSAHWLALCLNSRGEVVQSIGNRTSAPRELQVLMRPGRLLHEAELGTTAPGCVLEDHRTIVVNRGEHYLHELKEFFCASAPIMRPDGSFGGALDISGVDVDFLPLAHDMVGLAVRGIENRMLAALDGCTLLRFHCDERLLGTPFEGILAVGQSGHIVGANRSASRLLALGRSFGVGTSLDSLIENGLEGILRQGVHERETPLRLQSHLGSVVHSRVELPAGARRPATAPRPPVAEAAEHFPPGCVIEDPALIGAFRRARRVFGHGLPVLIEGETGTGKEMIARALHAAVRPEGPFVAVNCAAIPEGLIESELFGYAPGAFTGARRGGAVGRIEEAHQGVLLLDEIGDMAPSVQARLLRALQERSVVRVGDHRERPVDILVISATHRRLADMVEAGVFRQDLFYRLAGHILELPPLRARSDVEAVVSRLLLARAAELQLLPADGGPEDLLAPAALARLSAFRWPGNLRQLHNVLRALLALHEPGAPPLGLKDLPADIRDAPAAPDPALPAAPPGRLSDAKREAVRRALAEHDGNVSAAARALGVSRSTVYGILRRRGG